MLRIVPVLVSALLLAGPAMAQTSTAAQPGAAPSAPAGLAPAPSNPNLAVASVRMDGGRRASKIIGSAVYSDPNTQVASIDDLMIGKDNRIVFAILSVGGLVGIGGKLVAVPFDQLQQNSDGKYMLPGMTKDSLSAEPAFVY